MTDKKPEFKHVNKESDLDKLVAGDLVKVATQSVMGQQIIHEGMVAYGGIIDGKECFIEKGSCFLEGKIISWRIERKYLQFKEGTIIREKRHCSAEIYSPPSKYQNAKKLLEQAGLME